MLDIEGERLSEYRYTEVDIDISKTLNKTPNKTSNSNIERIRSILSEESEELRDIRAIDANSNYKSLKKSQIKINSHPDLSPDRIYTSRSKRLAQLSQKILLNKKWDNLTI